MAEKEISGLSFNLSADNDSAVSAIRSLSSAFKDLGKILNGNYFDNAAKGIDKIQKSIDSIDTPKISGLSKINKLDKIGKSFGSKWMTDSNFSKRKRAVEYSDTSFSIPKEPNFPDLKQQLSNNDSSDSSFFKMIENVTKASKPFTSSLSDMTKGVNTFFSAAKKASGLTGITSGLKDLIGTLEQVPIVDSFVTAITDMGSAVSRVMKSDIQPSEKVMLSFAAAGISAYKSVLKLVTYPFQKFANGINSIYKSWSHLTSAIGRIALYRLLRTMIKEITSGLQTGINNLYRWALIANNSFAPSMDSIATSMQYLQNSIGAMVSPLLNALAPAIEYIIDKFVELLNVVNQVFAALTGKSTWTKAIRQPKAYADAANDASKALNNFLLPIDEINKMSSSSSSSGGASTDYSSMFETVDIASKFADLANTSDWTSVGQSIATGINNAMASIDWGKITATEQLWATRIFTTLNGFINTLDWSLLGETIGKGIQTALDFVNTIMQNIQFETLGQGIGNALNNAFANIDWVTLGQVVTDGLRGLLLTLHGVLQTFDWNAFREDFVTGIKSAFANLNITQSIIDIATLASEILQTISAAINAVPWKEVGNALSQIDWAGIVGDVLDIIWQLVVGLCESGIGEVVFPAIGGYIGMQIGSLFGPLGTLIGLGIGTLVGWISDQIISSKDDIGSALSTIGDKVSEFIGGIGEWFMNIDWTSVGTTIGQGVAGINWAGILVNLGTFLLGIIGGAFEVIVGAISGFLVSIGQNIWDGLQDVGTNISTAWDNVKQDASDKWDEIKTNISDTWASISKKASDTWDDITKWITDNTGLSKTSLIDGWNSIKTDISTKWDNLKSKASTVWENISSTISTKTGLTKTSTIDTWRNICATLGNKWDDLKTTAGTKFKEINDTISDTFSGLWDSAYNWGKDLIDGFVQGINNFISDIGNACKNIADTIASWLHFSSPDVGPLANYETWMPDFMQGLANGIDDNVYQVASSMENLTAAMNVPSMSNDMSVANTVEYDNTNASQIQLLSEQNALLRQILAKDSNIKISDVGKASVKWINGETARTGGSPIAVF